MNRSVSVGMWLVAGAVLGLGVAACGEMQMMTGPCTAGSCGAGKSCHPITKACVPSCDMAAECPGSSRTCAPYEGDAGEKFCQCSTDALCSGANAGTVCNDATKQCEAKCGSGADAGSAFTCPTGFSCAASGNCVKAGTDAGTDAGVDAGVDAGMMDAGIACVHGAGTCGASFVCTNGRCVAPTACTFADGGQPAMCPYGQFCGTACAEAPVAPASCANFPAGSTPRAWNPSSDGGSSGPVIFASGPQSAQTFCTGTLADGGTGAVPSHVAMTFSAYTTGSPFPTAYDMFQTNQLRYFRTDGTSCDVSNLGTCGLFTPSRYANSRSTDGRNLTNTPTFYCPGASFNSLEVGLHFNGGNAFCGTAR